MKEASYWMKFLSEEEEELFLETISDKRGIVSRQRFFNDRYPSFYEFVSSAFIWLDTQEGFDYWYEIAHRDLGGPLDIRHKLKKFEL